jgi:hypothetical protein
MTRFLGALAVLLLSVSVLADGQLRRTGVGRGADPPPPPGQVVISTAATLPTGTQDAAYAAVTITCTGGVSPYTLSLIGGAFPTNIAISGMTITSSGANVTNAGDFSPELRCTDAIGGFGDKIMALRINPAVTGSCSGANPDDFFNCLVNLAMGAGGANVNNNLKVNANIVGWSNGSSPGHSFTSGFFYDFSADTNANKVDGAAVTIPINLISIPGAQQVLMPMNVQSGDVLFVWDWRGTPEWRLGTVCAGGGQVATQKTFQIKSTNQNSGSWFEIRQGYTGQDRMAGSGIIAGWNPVTSQSVGTDIATTDARSYQVNASGYTGTFIQGSIDSIPGMLNNKIVQKNLWTRYYTLVRMNAGGAWTYTPNGSTGNAELISLWVSDENTDAVQIYSNVSKEACNPNTPAAACIVSGTGKDQRTKLEFNSSSGGCTDGGNQSRRAYMRNVVGLHSVTGAIVASATSIAIAGTEVLAGIRPKA